MLLKWYVKPCVGAVVNFALELEGGSRAIIMELVASLGDCLGLCVNDTSVMLKEVMSMVICSLHLHEYSIGCN